MSDYKEENDIKLNDEILKENNIDEYIDKTIILNSSEDEADETDESQESEAKVSSAGKWVKGIIITLVLAALALTAAFSIFFSKKNYDNYDTVAEAVKAMPEGAGYEADYGKIICYNNEGISIYNEKGEMEWNAALNMTNPKLTANNGYAVVADIGGRNLLVVNHRAVPAVQVSLQMLQDILLADISEQGEIAVLMEADKGYNIRLINPYDKNKSLKAEIKTYSKEDGFALSLAMSKDGSKLVTEYVKNDKNEIKSILTFYNFDKIGENSNADRIVGVFPFEDTIFPKLKFADNNTVCAYGDNKIVCFAAKREPEILWKKKVAGKIERIAEDGSGFAILVDESGIKFTDSSEIASEAAVSSDYIDEDYLNNEAVSNGKQVLYSYNYSGSKNFSQEVDINAKKMAFTGGEVVICSENNCLIFNTDGSQKFKNKFKDEITSMIPTEDKIKYYTVLGKKLKIIRLTE